MEKKIIILISIDCLRADALEGFFDKGLFKKYSPSLNMPKTTTFNSLIKKGVFFTNCFTASSYTSSSHASIFTGKYPINSGVQEYFRTKIKEKTIFEIIKDKLGDRCATIFFTDYPIILGKYLGFDKKVDRYYFQDEREAINAIKEEEDKKDIISFFHFSNVHTPYGFSGLKLDNKIFHQKVKELTSEYNIKADQDIFDLDWPEKKYGHIEVKLRKIYHKAIEKMYEQKKYDQLMQIYLDGIEYFDKHRFYNFINELKKRKIFDKATFFIFADHGERWRDDSCGHYDNLYDDTIRVPLILIDPQLSKGNIVKEQIRTIDIIPSVAKLLNFKKLDFDGESLLPLECLKSRIALGEIWTSSSVNSVKSFMHKTVKKNYFDERDKDLPHGYLWKEYARYQNSKIINIYNESGNKATRCYIIKNGEEILIDNKNEEHQFLLKKMNDYRSGQSKAKSDDNFDISSRFKEYFKSLGYNV